MGERAAHRIERASLQCLLSARDVKHSVESVVDIAETESFLSERTFFYCSVFSFALRCFGPPTPALFKKIALGPLRGIVLPITAGIAKLLIEFDAFQDRSRDAFIEFSCDSRSIARVAPGGSVLVCPSCRSGLLDTYVCSSCGQQYQK